MENNNAAKFAANSKALKELSRTLPIELGAIGVREFVGNFTKQGYSGAPWKEVQRRTPGTKAYKYPKTKGLQRRTTPILIGAGYRKRGGTLRRAVNGSTKETSLSRVVWSVDLPYAKAQNDGTDKIPARPFMGFSKELIQKLDDKVNQRIKQALSATT